MFLPSYLFSKNEKVLFEIFFFEFNLNILQTSKEILSLISYGKISFHFKLDSIFQQSPLFRAKLVITSH